MRDVSTSNESDPAILPVNPHAEQFQVQILELHGYREFCLDRLNRLISLRGHLPVSSQLDPVLQQALVNRALYAAYRDCVSTGAKIRAARILAQAASDAR